MNTLKTVSALSLLVLLAGPAFAFEEQNGGTTQPAPATQSEPGSSVQTPQSGFATPSSDASDDQGTEISLPGLGTLGVLPKMDFGLELLYGADGEAPTEELQDPDASSDDLRIRGTIKHQF